MRILLVIKLTQVALSCDQTWCVVFCSQSDNIARDAFGLWVFFYHHTEKRSLSLMEKVRAVENGDDVILACFRARTRFGTGPRLGMNGAVWQTNRSRPADLRVQRWRPGHSVANAASEEIAHQPSVDAHSAISGRLALGGLVATYGLHVWLREQRRITVATAPGPLPNIRY